MRCWPLRGWQSRKVGARKLDGTFGKELLLADFLLQRARLFENLEQTVHKAEHGTAWLGAAHGERSHSSRNAGRPQQPWPCAGWPCWSSRRSGVRAQRSWSGERTCDPSECCDAVSLKCWRTCGKRCCLRTRKRVTSRAPAIEASAKWGTNQPRLALLSTANPGCDVGGYGCRNRR